MKRKILSIAVVLAIILLLSAFAGNEEDTPDEIHMSSSTANEMIDFLLDRGYPSDYLEGLIPPQMEALYKLSYEKNAYYLYTEEQSTIQPCANIPESQLTFNVTYSYTPIKYNGITYIYETFVYIDYSWNELPYVRNIDAITANWDSSVLVYNDNFSATDYAYSNVEHTWKKYKTWTKPSALDQGGLGIYTYLDYQELVDGVEWVGAGGLRGHITFSLTPEPRFSMGLGPGSNATVINCVYTHSKSPLTCSLSFTYNNLGVYVNLGASQDSIADSKRIDYTRYN